MIGRPSYRVRWGVQEPIRGCRRCGFRTIIDATRGQRWNWRGSGVGYRLAELRRRSLASTLRCSLAGRGGSPAADGAAALAARGSDAATCSDGGPPPASHALAVNDSRRACTGVEDEVETRLARYVVAIPGTRARHRAGVGDAAAPPRGGGAALRAHADSLSEIGAATAARRDGLERAEARLATLKPEPASADGPPLRDLHGAVAELRHRNEASALHGPSSPWSLDEKWTRLHSELRDGNAPRGTFTSASEPVVDGGNTALARSGAIADAAPLPQPVASGFSRTSGPPAASRFALRRASPKQSEGGKADPTSVLKRASSISPAGNVLSGAG